ncbi:MAG: rhodanese-like domain-containing protein [Clostridia bacterium]|nr:rhodanese-like domain-containing protein [Clostridia bacterium]
MGFFEFLMGPNINRGLEEYDETPDALLLDVRTEEEYRQGHIPGSRNVPLQDLERIFEVADNMGTPLYLYCRSGARSSRAAAQLLDMGYTKVRNLGGISAYRGKVERWA